MSFFDKKSDVISIELTQYGKYLLSTGKFKPVYYEFFDSDVIYDNESAGIVESRNNIQERIKNQTPYLKPQYTFSGIETKLKEQIKLKKQLQNQTIKNGKPVDDAFTIQQPQEKIYFGAYPLGTSNLDDKYPSFKINFYDCKIKNTSLYKNLDTFILHTPQINLETIECETSVIKNTEKPLRSEQQVLDNLALEASNFPESNVFTTDLFSDSTYIELKNKYILFEIEENDANDLGDVFEIELYEISSSIDGTEIYRPLKFKDDQQSTSNINYAEYFFEIKLDNEIESEILKGVAPTTIKPRTFQKIEK